MMFLSKIVIRKKKEKGAEYDFGLEKYSSAI